MNRIFLALIAASTISIAAPVSAMPVAVDFPVLTYPTHPTPGATKSSARLTMLNGILCTTGDRKKSCGAGPATVQCPCPK